MLTQHTVIVKIRNKLNNLQLPKNMNSMKKRKHGGDRRGCYRTRLSQERKYWETTRMYLTTEAMMWRSSSQT